MKTRNFLFSLLLLSFVSTAQAGEGLRIRCGTTRLPSVSLLIFNYNPSGLEFNETQLLSEEGEYKNVRVKAVKGPRHRPGIEGYRVEVATGSSPLAPRTIYAFSTKHDCSLQVYRKAGIGREHAIGPELNCSCRPIDYADN